MKKINPSFKLVITLFIALILVTSFNSFKVEATNTTYYIDSAGGNDNNNGLTIDSPWQTISKVNSTIFTAADSILFKKGSIWREQLTINSSGNNISPITFSSYGTGNAPIISGSDLNSGTEVNTRSRTLLVAGKSYITISNLQFEHSKTSNQGGIYINNSDHIVLSSLTVKDNDGFAGIYIEGNGSNIVQNSRIYNTKHATADRGDGIIVDGSNGSNTISGNTIYSNHASGIRIALFSPTLNTLIASNEVYQNGAAGISLNTGSASNIIEKNIVYSNVQTEPDYYNIDLFKVGNNNLVRYNTVHNSNFVALDSGGIRFDGDPGGVFGSGNTIYYNIIYNERTGIHLLGAKNGEVYNNTIYNSALYGINIHGSTANGNIVKNNIIHTAGTHLIYNEDAANSTIDYNLYYPDGPSAFKYNSSASSNFANWKTTSNKDSHSTSQDPKLTNTLINNFSLNSDSPAINSGINVSLTSDFQGNLLPSGAGYDIGAFEFISTQSPKGCNGDYNKNNIVDLSDFALFAQNYKKSGISCSLDITGDDCFLNISDFQLFSQVYKISNLCLN